MSTKHNEGIISRMMARLRGKGPDMAVVAWARQKAAEDKAVREMEDYYWVEGAWGEPVGIEPDGTVVRGGRVDSVDGDDGAEVTLRMSMETFNVARRAVEVELSKDMYDYGGDVRFTLAALARAFGIRLAPVPAEQDTKAAAVAVDQPATSHALCPDEA